MPAPSLFSAAVPPPPALDFEFRESAPRRLDLLVAERLPDVSRAFVRSLIAEGKVTVNGRPSVKGRMVGEGDRVRVAAFAAPGEAEILPNPDIALDVVWEGPAFLVVDKPAGLPTHPHDPADRNTLASALVARFPELRGLGRHPLEPGLVHRLDTDTSGLLLAARTPEWFARLTAWFAEKRIAKTYLALVLGEVTAPGGVDLPIAHHARDRRKMTVVGPGTSYRSRLRPAETRFRPLECLGDVTLVAVEALTGRMHQVRVHLAAIGHPLAGDVLYQSDIQRRHDPTTALGHAGHFLHAHRLVLPENEAGPREFVRELPPDRATLLDRLRARRSWSPGPRDLVPRAHREFS